MEKYIPKSALVAEIENLLKPVRQRLERDKEDPWDSDIAVYKFGIQLIKNIDTLEVKEVDFSTGIYKYIDEHFNVYDDGNQTLQTKDKKSLIGMVDVENIAKHFFELGLKAQKRE